jgi:hypothetical protein
MVLFVLSEDRAGSGRRSMHIHTSTIGTQQLEIGSKKKDKQRRRRNKGE